MVLQSPPAFLQAGTYSALSDRLHLVTAMTMRDMATAHRGRQGFYPDRFPAYSNPSGMNWSVGACAGVVANTFTTDGGEYRFVNPTNVTGTFAASSPTLNRHDILGFRVRDNFYDSSGFNDVIPSVVQGANSAGTPVDPALPSSFIPVLRAVINAAATTPTLQDLRVKTVPPMAIFPVANTTERATLGSPPAGFTIWHIALARFEVADGAGGWTALPGAADVPVIGGEVRASVGQTFAQYALSKLNFGTQSVTPSGITWNGSNQWTVTTAGAYTMSAFVSTGYNAGNNFLLCIGRTALTGVGNTGEMWTGWSASGPGGTDASVSAKKYLQVGDTICAYIYINGGTQFAPQPGGLDQAPAAEFAVWKDR